MKEFNYVEFIRDLNLQEGDIIDVASDLMSIMLYCRKHKLKFQPDALIDALVDAVGASGTVMIRTFSWAFCKGEEFDILSTPSQVGSLGTVAMKRSDFQRTRHPIYSWMVAGKCQQELCGLQNVAAFGRGTPFDFLYHRNGKQILLGNAKICAMTQLHHAEKLEEVPYRFEKKFIAPYRSEDGRKISACYTMYVRYLDIDVSDDIMESDETQNELIKRNIKQESIYGQELHRAVSDLKKLTDFIQMDIRTNGACKVISINGQKGYRAQGIDYSILNKK